MNWRVIPYSRNHPAWNMAVDEAIFHSYSKNTVPATIRFYGWDPPSVSLGYFQDIEKEINLAGLMERGFGLVRRNTGGRAVLHHHELTYSVVAGIRDNLPDNLIGSYLYISKALVEALTTYHISVAVHEGAAVKYQGTGACFEAPSWYEITVAGRKLVGSAQFRQKGSLLQHGSILFDFSASDLGAVLKLDKMPIKEWTEKICQKVTSLKELGIVIPENELADAIIVSFERLYGIRFTVGALLPDEIELANRLMIEKYGTKQWNFSRGSTENIARSIG